MFIGAIALHRKHPEISAGPNITAAVLMTRTDYTQDEDNLYKFTHVKSGKTLLLENGDSVLSIIHKMANLEVPTLLYDQPSSTQFETLAFINAEIDRLNKN